MRIFAVFNKRRPFASLVAGALAATLLLGPFAALVMKLDLEDQILRETLVTHEGRIYHEPTRLSLEKGGSS